VSQEVRLPLAGGCVCGKVRYALTGAPLLAYACHCHACQKRTGSAFSLAVVVRRADLELSGHTALQPYATANGDQAHGVCPDCGARVWGYALAAPDYASIRGGTFDDASWIVPIAQTWVESAIPWAVIPGVRNVAWEAFDFHALGEEWRASAPRFIPA
jgi:hypothetical protein